MLFERFISKERNEPPDIDVDFEHERREEVIQYLYGKYGRERTALAATVICYRAQERRARRRQGARPAAAIRSTAEPSVLLVERRGRPGRAPARARLRSGQSGDAPRADGRPGSCSAARGTCRSTSVVSSSPNSRCMHLVPVENAAMPDRTIIQWDKDDLETLGLLKVDCLALGMLTCVRKCLELLSRIAAAT